MKLRHASEGHASSIGRCLYAFHRNNICSFQSKKSLISNKSPLFGNSLNLMPNVGSFNQALQSRGQVMPVITGHHRDTMNLGDGSFTSHEAAQTLLQVKLPLQTRATLLPNLIASQSRMFYCNNYSIQQLFELLLNQQ